MNTADRKEILELYAAAFKVDNYPPTAGKILGLLYTSNQRYFSFEDLIDAVDVTKSAISKALKFLETTGEVSYIYDEKNKRKRLFYLDIVSVKEQLYKNLQAYHTQIKLMEASLKLRNEENKDLNSFIKTSIEFYTEVLNYYEERLKNHF
ncbi:hypothetical protein [Tenacibaculum sp. 190130A14a]|uniref:Uncharacterized protein n=1 Tax=Tenacibaculum polynesiense TaxID=3137857 RepID=A0ABM9P8Z7_9FLAO